MYFLFKWLVIKSKSKSSNSCNQNGKCIFTLNDSLNNPHCETNIYVVHLLWVTQKTCFLPFKESQLSCLEKNIRWSISCWKLKRYKNWKYEKLPWWCKRSINSWCARKSSYLSYFKLTKLQRAYFSFIFIMKATWN